MRNFNRVLLFALLVSGATLSCAENTGHSDDYPEIGQIHDFLYGDESLWPIFESCATTRGDCAIVAGVKHLEESNYEDAERLFNQALEHNHPLNALPMILLNVERDNPVEAFAWSQLQLNYQMQSTGTELADQDQGWAFEQLYLALEQLNDDQADLAYDRAEQLIQQWLPTMLDTEQERKNRWQSQCSCSKPTRRKRPNYPMTLARDGRKGVTMHVFSVDSNGKVDDDIAIFYTHQAFRHAGHKAIRGWRFPEMTEKCEDQEQRRYSQQFDFSFAPR